MADTVGESTSTSAGAGAQKREARDTLWRRRLNSARAHAQQGCREQGAAEYQLLESMRVDLVAAAALACSSVLASLALALHAATAGPQHSSFQSTIALSLSRGDPPPLSVSRALHVISSCVLCSAPPAVYIIYLLEALDLCVCTKWAWCFCLHISHFCCFR